MTPQDAAKLLEIANDATAEKIEARFHELRAALEDKIAKAPTPGLKAKYRETLDNITLAFETLTLAADSSTLPVLERLPEARPASSPPPLSPVGASQKPSAKPKKSADKTRTEFLLVVLTALALLIGGAWWVMKTRADKAESARLAAEEKAADEHRTKALAELRIKLSEAKVAWEGLEKTLQPATQKSSELRSEARNIDKLPDDAAAHAVANAQVRQAYAEWLQSYLARHPIRSLLARAGALIDSKSLPEAEATLAELAKNIETAAQEIDVNETLLCTTQIGVTIDSEPRELSCTVTTRFAPNRTLTTRSVTKVSESTFVGFGPAIVHVARPGWEDYVESLELKPGEHINIFATFPAGSARIASTPSGLRYVVKTQRGLTFTGTTPASLDEIPPGSATITVSRPGFADQSGTVEIVNEQTATYNATLVSEVFSISGPQKDIRIFVDGKLVGTGSAKVPDLTPGEHTFMLASNNSSERNWKQTFTIRQAQGTREHTFDWSKITEHSERCPKCKGSGKKKTRCDECSGRGKQNCSSCEGKGWYMGTSYFDNSKVRRECPYCKGRQTFKCAQCDGIGSESEDCPYCYGERNVSPLKLQNEKP